MSQRELRPLREVQMMFQDPAESLNSRFQYARIRNHSIFKVGKDERNAMVDELLKKGLPQVRRIDFLEVLVASGGGSGR